jgi:hypothetical protein
VDPFVSKHADDVIGTLSGFDRLVFRGTLRILAHRAGMMAYLWAARILLKNFASHAEALTKQLREASEGAARRTGRPIRYLPSSVTNKEQIAREIAEHAPAKAGGGRHHGGADLHSHRCRGLSDL